MYYPGFFSKQFRYVWISLAMFLLQHPVVAQISTLPQTERFNLSFLQGENIEFLPNWYGNEVESDRRIFQVTESGTGNKLMGIIPTSAFTADIQVRLNLAAYKNVNISFRAKSEKNGDGTRASLLYMETSLDGGNTWISRRLLKRFENGNTGFSNYNYILPGGADNRSTVVVRFEVERSADGDNTAPKVLIDDVAFQAGATDVSKPEVSSVVITNNNSIRVNFSEAVGTSAANIANYTGVPNLTSAVRTPNNQAVTLTYNPGFQVGVFYTLTVNNVLDISGNAMENPFQFDFVFNPGTPNLVITEIMYNPPEMDADSLEFVEVYNNGSSTAILGGLRFSDGIDFVFPEDTLAPGAFVLVAAKADAAANQYGKSFYQWTSGALNNAGEKLVMKNTLGVTIDSVRYRPDWGGDGDGRSLVLCNPSAENSSDQNWTVATTPFGGTINDKQIFAHPGASCPDDILPSVRFIKKGETVIETSGTITVEIVLANGNASASSVQVALDPITSATLTQDFTASVAFPYTVNFPAGTSASTTFTIQIVNNIFPEPMEQLVLNLINPSNAEVGNIGSYTIDILDDDNGVPPVCINEIMASNSNVASDEEDENDDWIELHNSGSEPVSLAGYYISDNKLNPTKYRIPSDDPAASLIPPKGYLIVWADNQPNQGNLHTNFALSSSGEFIGLFMPNGFTIVDSLTFPAQQTDISYGRDVDCGGKWTFFNQPTFGKSNVVSSVSVNSLRTLKAHPNPVSGDVLNISEPIDFQMFDVSGRWIMQGKAVQQMDVSDLSPGMYFIITDQQEILKIIVNR